MTRLAAIDAAEPARLQLDALFPVKGAIAESLQIGREAVVADLVDRLLAGDDILMIEPRRVGKSSTLAGGALLRIHQQFDGVVASVDLRVAGIEDAESLADALIESAKQTGAGRPVSAEKAKLLARKATRFVNGERARAAADLTREASRLKTAQTIAALIVGELTGIERLTRVLAALETEAELHVKPVVVFIDEVQDLALRWESDGDAVQRLLERHMRTPDRKVTFVFSGSEESAMKELFARGRPLYFEGERYPLPPISSEAWATAITERYAKDGRVISQACVDEILASSDGLPLRTMQVCRVALRLARATDRREISSAIIDQAIAQVQEHPSWRT